MNFVEVEKSFKEYLQNGRVASAQKLWRLISPKDKRRLVRYSRDDYKVIRKVIRYFRIDRKKIPVIRYAAGKKSLEGSSQQCRKGQRST